MNIIHPCPHALNQDCPLRPEKPVFGFDGCVFHRDGKAVVLRNGYELVIADVLWKNFGKTVTVDKFCSALWGSMPDSDIPENVRLSISVEVCRLRKKLKEIGLAIKTVHKRGYRMEPLQ